MDLIPKLCFKTYIRFSQKLSHYGCLPIFVFLFTFMWVNLIKQEYLPKEVKLWPAFLVLKMTNMPITKTKKRLDMLQWNVLPCGQTLQVGIINSHRTCKSLIIRNVWLKVKTRNIDLRKVHMPVNQIADHEGDQLNYWSTDCDAKAGNKWEKKKKKRQLFTIFTSKKSDFFIHFWIHLLIWIEEAKKSITFFGVSYRLIGNQILNGPCRWWFSFVSSAMILYINVIDP